MKVSTQDYRLSPDAALLPVIAWYVTAALLCHRSSDANASVQIIVLLLVCIILGPCHTQQVGAETQPAQPEGLLSGLGRLVQSFALDFGTHAAHLLLNGLPPEDLATSKPAGEAPSMYS